MKTEIQKLEKELYLLYRVINTQKAKLNEMIIAGEHYSVVYDDLRYIYNNNVARSELLENQIKAGYESNQGQFKFEETNKQKELNYES